jgi:hypothetical protein
MQIVSSRIPADVPWGCPEPVKCPFCNPVADEIVAKYVLWYARRDRVLGVVVFLGDREFPLKPLQDLLYYLHHFSVGDCLPMKGSRPPKQHEFVKKQH